MNDSQKKLIKACAGGDVAAEAFLCGFWDRAHWLDDLIDNKIVMGANQLAIEDMAAREAQWMLLLTTNAFFLRHNQQLLPLMLLGLNAWLDSTSMKPGHVRDVVKGVYHEVFYAVALLTGGWARLRGVTSSLRAYDIEPAY